ncbi:MAG: AlpA family phage regulatory protein [Vicinamibacterales bacterium]
MHDIACDTIDQIIRPRLLAEKLGISLTTLWRLRRRGELPAPIRISARTVGWRVRDITALLDARQVAGR